jgi:hypothetical protein
MEMLVGCEDLGRLGLHTHQKRTAPRGIRPERIQTPAGGASHCDFQSPVAIAGAAELGTELQRDGEVP